MRKQVRKFKIYNLFLLLFFTLSIPYAYAQKKEIRGSVRDSIGFLPGVSINVKNNSGIGTTTDVNGKYILEVPDENSVLVFKMVGFTPQEVSVRGREVINITLNESTSQLDEVVVLAFGEKRSVNEVVGSVTTINPSELKVPSSNLTTALAGRAAGVIAYQRSGEPGQDNADFFIRGVTTFGYKKDPLILIDGVELTTTDLARLQTDDIASFSIMKDATSTALYGARGANGVILVTTKSGVTGKAKLNFRIENSVSAPTDNVELADPVTYMRLNNEAILTRNPLAPTQFSQQKIDRTIAGLNPYVYPATDWRDELIKDYTLNQRLNMNISGGGSVARYYVAGSISQDNGLLKVDKVNNFNNNIDFKTYTLRSNVNIDLTKSTEMIVRLNGTFDEYNGPIGGGTSTYRNIMRSNPALFPKSFPTDEDHKYVKHILFGNFDQGRYLNPYADMVKGYKDYSRSMMLAQLELKQNLSSLVEGLSFRTMANTTRNAFFDVSRFYNPFFYSVGSYDRPTDSYKISGLNDTETSSIQGDESLDFRAGDKLINSTFYMENALNYDRTFNKHGISGMLIHIMRQDLSANGSTLQLSLPSRNLGLSGRATYSYANRYFGEFNFGYNGSERFHESRRYGFFPSAGLAWNVSNEKFFEPIKSTITNLRLRATYGLVGNDAIGSPSDRFFYLSQVDRNGPGATFGENYNVRRPGYNISRYANNDITWETAIKQNLALELSLFDKLNFIGEYFMEYRKNILMTRNSIPSSMGLSAVTQANVGEASGQGVDLSMDYSEIFSKDFWIQSRVNFTYATSAYEVFEEPQYDEKHLSRIGYSTSQQWGYIAERLFVDDNEVKNSPAQFGSIQSGTLLGGDIKYRDVNGDGQITTRDRVPLGFPTIPEIVYGFGTSVGFKNMDVSVFFQGLSRESFWIDVNATAPFVSYRYPGEAFAGNNPNPILENQLLKAYANNHWSEENNRDMYALWPRLSTSRNVNNTQISNWFMRNGSFLRLKSAELGYTLPRRLTSKLDIQKFRIYLSGSNLLSWSKFKLWDPEMAGNGLGYPVQRVINLGLNINL
jgi:TonB-linked SusC/RagA family outer membrane protein